MVLRAAVWKSTRQPNFVGLPVLMLSAIAALIGGFVYEYAQAGATAHFVPYGINASLASMVVILVVSAVFVRPEARTTFLSAIMLLFAMTSLGGAVVMLGKSLTAFEPPKAASWAGFAAVTVLFVIYVVWWGGAIFMVQRNLEPGRRYVLLRTAGLWAAMVVANMALPYEPAFRGRDFDIRTANYWEYIPAVLSGSFQHDAAPPPRRVNRAQVELAQPALLDAALAQLAPQVKGKTEIYALGIAGSSDQDVFSKELNGGLERLSRVFSLDGRVVRLSNQVDTAASVPAASRQNFAAAVRTVAQVMDRDDDVLLLFMTSHGSNDGVSLSLAGAFYADLSPGDVAAVLEREGIKNRIVIVSACYSGVFLKTLANEHSIILTAADDSHPSFGCSNGRDWTYFGDAFFNRSLHPGGTIEDAFLDAKVAIAQWEVRDGLTPSNPQGFFGQALMDKLAPLYLHANADNAMASPIR
jgi:hypothetical protein